MMDVIFHEKQDGSLCAKHCLNALLQGEYFTAVDLATLANKMDEAERQHMAEGGVNSEEYRQFLQQPSSNMDDSGYFSIQVIASALEVWNLELIPYNSQHPIAQIAKKDPVVQSAFICNYRDHWFTIRKLGNQWFNLNSLLTGPELISDTYLDMFLFQLQKEGYSIFIVQGNLPESEADQLLKVVPAVQTTKPKLLAEVRAQAATQQERELMAQNSRLNNDVELPNDQTLDDDAQLQKALRLSLNEFSEEHISDVVHPSEVSLAPGCSIDSSDEKPRLRDRVVKGHLVDSLGAKESTINSSSFSSEKENIAHKTKNSTQSVLSQNAENISDSEEEMLQVALKMSMEQDSG